MILNTSLISQITNGDRHLWCEVMDVISVTGDYLRTFPKIHNFPVECHSICRAVALRIPKLRCIDGYFLGIKKNKADDYCLSYCNHSWLLTPDDAIIDPYPVGCIATNPIIIVPTGNYTAYGKELYFQSNTVRSLIDLKCIYRKTSVLYRFIQEAEYKEKSRPQVAA